MDSHQDGRLTSVIRVLVAGLSLTCLFPPYLRKREWCKAAQDHSPPVQPDPVHSSNPPTVTHG